MKILVCVKQVPDPEVELELTPQGLVEAKRDAFVMNRLDEYAMEEALSFCEGLGQGVVEAITVGLERTEATLRRALAMGASHGIFIPVDEDRALTSFETASLITHAVKDRGYDLIVTGVMSEDEMAGAVGPMIAGIMDIPWATSVVAIQQGEAENTLRIQREGDGGAQENLEMALPALVTIQSGTRQPRYPNLTNMLRANKQELEVVEAEAQWQEEAREKIVQAALPEQKGQGFFIEGSTEEKARELVKIFKERALL